MEEEEEPQPSQPLLPNGEEHSRRKLIMSNLKDSLLSHLSESNPSLKTSNASSSIIHRRLHHLFTSFNTPTHPPYALMIHRAITELNDENGSTEEAISDFIRKEYDDLPWAHERILGIQLERLCQDKELVCNEGGTYVLVAEGGDRVGSGGKEEAEECKRSRKKRKRDKKRNDHDNVDGLAGERKRKVAKRDEVVERGDEVQEGGGIREQGLLHGSDSAGSDGPIGVVACTQENGELALNQSIERVEEHAKSEKVLTEVVGKRNQSQRQGTGVIERRHTEAESPAQESQLQQDSILQSETNCSFQLTALDALVDSRQPLVLPTSKCVPSAETELSLTQVKLQVTSSLDVSEQKQDENRVFGGPKQHCLKRLCRGRPPKSKPAADSQGDSLIPFRDVIINALKANGNKIKKQWPSQPQGRGIGRGRRRKQHRILKNKVVLACVNVHNEQPQHGNQGGPKGNFHENPVSGDAKQNPPKRPRGRPKLQTVANDQEVLILSSDDGITSEKKPNINKMEKQHQDGWGRGRGRGRGKGKGRGRRGRPPILNGNVNNYEMKLQREDPAQQPGRGRGRGGSRGRGRGRPPILNGNANHYEKQLQRDDQAQQHGRGRGRGRGRGKGRGRPKLNRNEGLVSFSNPVGEDNQSLEQNQLQLQSQQKQGHQQQDQGWDQNQEVGQERPSNPVLDANKQPPAASPISMLRSTSGLASSTKLETESNSPENYIAS